MSIDTDLQVLKSELQSIQDEFNAKNKEIVLREEAIRPEFLAQLQKVIEGGLLAELVIRLGYAKEVSDKTMELTQLVMNPVTAESAMVIE